MIAVKPKAAMLAAMLAVSSAPALSDTVVDIQVGGDKVDPRQCLFFYTDGGDANTANGNPRNLYISGYKGWLAVPYYSNDVTTNISGMSPRPGYSAAQETLHLAFTAGFSGFRFNFGPETPCNVDPQIYGTIPTAIAIGMQR